MMKLYDRIKEICSEQGIDVATLERRCGFDGGCIRKWNESEPGAIRLNKVAKALDVTVDSLLAEESA